MKIRILVTFFSFSFLFLGLNEDIKAQGNSADKDITVMLKDFYSQYITECSSGANSSSEKKLNNLRKKYCTEDGLIRYKKLVEETDSDPFLKAQDCDSVWLKTISIRKSNKKPNLYTVSYSYKYEFDHGTINIRLVVIKQNGIYKIDSMQ